MADPATVTAPDITGTIDQRFFIRPLGGPQHPQNYLDNFPEGVYNKSFDSHLVKFIYALLGPAGAGWLRKNYLEARLLLEDYGIDTFDLDAFYGDPLAFGRIIEETYDDDPHGLLSHVDWERIRAKDARYRNRALDYVNGARLGNTPEGMHLVARSGIGHEVEVVENYRYIYDQLSDDQLELPSYGVSNSTEEMIVLPRRELPQSEVQVLTITGSPTGGTFNLFYPVGEEAVNATANIAYNASRVSIRQFLEAIPSIGVGNVIVDGGPLPDTPVTILFTGELANRDVPKLQVDTIALTGGTTPAITVVTKYAGINQAEELVSIGVRDQRYLQQALSRIKPVTTLVSFHPATGVKNRQLWNKSHASSVYNEVIRYATGATGIPWPTRNNKYWIETAVEHAGPRAYDDLQHHYFGNHNVANILAYTEVALSDPDYLTDNWLDVAATYRNEHIGAHSILQQWYAPILAARGVDFQYLADRALADYAEPLTVTANSKGQTDPIKLINGIYPVEYQTLPGVPEVKYKEDQFWSSVERPEGDDYLEIDLGSVQAVNHLSFEVTRKPYDIEVHYDILDQAPSRDWEPVTFEVDVPSSTSIGYDVGSQNPWINVNLWFENSKREMIFTRFIRLTFKRRTGLNSPFTDVDGTLLPYSTEVRNLRVGRNVS